MMVERPASILSIFSIVLSMTLAALGSGVIFAYVPFTLAQEGHPAWIAGSAITAVAGGGIVGCFIAGPLIRRVGHARAFACACSLIILSGVLVALGVVPALWIFSRALYGLAANVNFIITQSWLNHAAANEWRGRAMSVFYMAYVVGLGSGSFLFGQLPDGGHLGPLVATCFYTLAILPIGLTRLATPPAPESVRIDVVKAWRISPVGLAGILASGGLSMVVQGFTPIYAAGSGLERGEVALLMFLMQLGMLGVQLPLGAISDRTDRRYVLIATSLLIAGAGMAATSVSFSTLMLAILVFAIWSGATETVYSVANAHSNDRAGPGDYVPLASTMLVAWSVSAFVFPAAVTAATPAFGPRTYMYVAIAIALVYAAFVILRLRSSRPVEASETEAFELRTAQIPNAEALVAPEAFEPAEQPGSPDMRK